MKNIIIEIKTLMDGVMRKLDTVRNNGDGCNGIIMDINLRSLKIWIKRKKSGQSERFQSDIRRGFNFNNKWLRIFQNS